jgi:phosphate:Na+ symporter
MFDEKLIEESPSLALEYMKKTILYMGSIVKDYFDIAREFSFKNHTKLIEEAYTHEMMIDTYDQKLHDYLIKISTTGLDGDDSKRLSRDLDTIKDFERIGDHLTNIVQFFEQRYQESVQLSTEGAKDLESLYEVLSQMIDKTLESFMNQDIKLAREVIELEDVVDEMEERFRYRFIERLKNREVIFTTSANYPDILANLERIGDHLMNIVSSVIEPLYVPQSILVPKPHEIDKDI